MRIKSHNKNKDYDIKEILKEANKIRRFLERNLGIRLRVKVIVSNRKNSESYFDEDKNMIRINIKDIGWKGFPEEGKDIRYIIFHEFGHKIFKKFKIPQLKGSEIFGEFDKKYDEKRITYFRRIHQNPSYVSLYAQTHPEEDFCETFALYFYRKYTGRKTYTNSPQNDDIKRKMKFIKGLFT